MNIVALTNHVWWKMEACDVKPFLAVLAGRQACRAANHTLQGIVSDGVSTSLAKTEMWKQQGVILLR